VCLLLAGPVQAQPAPTPLSILDVPFISQSEALCGGAAAAMVLRYWGERGLSAESFAHLIDRSAAGIRTSTLVEDLRGRGWNAVAVAGTDARVSAELARGRPVLTLIEDRPGTFHYIVVVAATPQAVVFHDPARSPFRVMHRASFARRWAAADRWMAIVVPGAPVEPPTPAAAEVAVGDPTCDALLAEGVRQAQSNELDAAERSLTSALSCGGSAPLRELAGLRLLQRRWPEVSEMATAALAEDPLDAPAWELLATSRFVQDDPTGALEAWNRINQPRVDLVAVGGLTRTRQRVVERLLAVAPPALLTTRLFTLSARRLQELPSASSTRLEFVPTAGGVAELRAHVVERPLLPADVPGYAALGLMAAVRREVEVSSGAVTGGGERFTVGWRFWPGRPRLSGAVVAPAPWGGVWGVEAFAERQPFTGDLLPAAHRTAVRATLSNWVTSWARVSIRGGVDRWDSLGSYGAAAGALRLSTPGDLVDTRFEFSGWAGPDAFGITEVAGTVRSTTERRGRVWVGRAGAATATVLTPPDLWFAGDTGRARGMPLRAHPVITDGRVRVERIGRRIAYASGEAQHWWTGTPRVRVGAALFVDTAVVQERLLPGPRSDVDAGLGVRLAVPGMTGVVRIDLAKGLRDGATALSFVWEP